MLRNKSLARFLVCGENQSAFSALQDLALSMSSDRTYRPSLLFLHGSPGTGKSHLVAGLAKEITAEGGKTVQIMSGGDFREPSARQSKKGLAIEEGGPVADSLVDDANDCDVLIFEDVQRLAPAAEETFVRILDHRRARELPTVITGTTGPRHLVHRGSRFSARLASRLAGGLVISLEPLKAASRQKLLEELAQSNQLALPREIIQWLARSLTGGGRQLEGAISQLVTLSKLATRPLDLKIVVAHFRSQVEAIRPTVERIAGQVGGHYRLEPRHLQSKGRQRSVLLPRQISMYLARQLTSLSLEQIGAYFGGRDHSTVLHACRKVERAIKKDAVLSGTVRQLHAELA